MSTTVLRDCPYCETSGCSECDHTGTRATTVIDLPDGQTMTVRGSQAPSADALAALEAVGRAALAQLDGPS